MAEIKPLPAQVERIPVPRLFARCRKDANGCWVWQGTKCREHYARLLLHIGKDQRNIGLNRLIYTYFFGPIPDGLLVLHSCDNPACICPRHLRVGTASENQQESFDKGRNSGQTNRTRDFSKPLLDEVWRRYVYGEPIAHLIRSTGLNRKRINAIIKIYRAAYDRRAA